MDAQEKKRRQWWAKTIAELKGDRQQNTFAGQLEVTPQTLRDWLGLTKRAEGEGVSAVDPNLLSIVVWEKIATLRQLSVQDLRREMLRECGEEVPQLLGKSQALAAIRAANPADAPVLIREIANLLENRGTANMGIAHLIKQAIAQSGASAATFAEYLAPLQGESLEQRAEFIESILAGESIPDAYIGPLMIAYQQFTGRVFSESELQHVAAATRAGVDCMNGVNSPIAH